LGCNSTNSTTRSRIRATELAVDATMDKAGIPNGRVGLRSVRQIRNDTYQCRTYCNYLIVQIYNLLITLLHEAAELHLAVPLSILTGEVFVVSLQNIAFLTEVFNHSAMRKSLA